MKMLRWAILPLCVSGCVWSFSSDVRMHRLEVEVVGKGQVQSASRDGDAFGRDGAAGRLSDAPGRQPLIPAVARHIGCAGAGQYHLVAAAP